MGFFDGIGNAFKNVGDVGGGIVKGIGTALPITAGLAGIGSAGIPGAIGGLVGGEYLRNQLQGGGPDSPQAPGVDPRYKEIKDSQFKQAKDFRGNLSGFENDLFRDYRNMGLRDLASQVKTTSNSLGRRGLGYGGIAEGAQAKNAANFSYGMAKGKSDIHRSSEDMANQLDADALNSGLLFQKTQQGIQDTVYNQAIQEYQNRNSAMNGIFQGAGQGIGMGLARRTS